MEESKKLEDRCVIELNGRRIDINKITNPKLRRVFKDRVHDSTRFLFNYSDGHTEHHDKAKKYSDYKDYSDYNDYNDHTEHTDYREFGCDPDNCRQSGHRDFGYKPNKYKDWG